MPKVLKDIIGKTFSDLTISEYLGKNDKKQHIYKAACQCGNIVEVLYGSVVNSDRKSCGKCRRTTIPKDLTGQKFGMLTVLEKGPNLSSNKTSFKVKCDCGVEKYVKTSNLISGKSKSCGCQVNYNKVQLIGKRFGRLFVRESAGVSGRHRCYICDCDCGNECIIDGTNLTSGRSNSCGCLQKELASKRAALQTGESNPAWKGGTSASIRKCKEYKHWRNAVLKRDKGVCKLCGDNKNLEAHHLYAVSTYPEKAHDVQNGITLCNTCHTCFHIDYGSGDNTPEQLASFAESLRLNIYLP